MLKHYLLVALRAARRAPIAFGMNVATLAVGLVCFVTAYGFAEFWRSADRHFPNAERIHLLGMELSLTDGSFSTGGLTTPEHLAEYLRADFPAIETVARAIGLGQEDMVSTGDRALRMSGFAAEPAFLEIFALPFIAGDPRRALSAPGSAVITQEFATQLFGDDDPMGRSVVIGSVADATVAGVIGPIPEPSHMGRSASASTRFDLLVSMDVLETIRERTRDANAPAPRENWLGGNARTYVVLPADGSLRLESLRDQLPAFVDRHMPKEMQEFARVSFDAVPLDRVLGDAVEGGMFLADLDLSVPDLLLLLGALVLGVACVNYANLATARAAGRGRDIGLRKALGARPRQVMAQALLEAGVAAAAAIAIALAVFKLAAPVWSTLLGTDPTGSLFKGAGFWLFLLALLAAVTLAAGAYPAFLLSRVRPMTTLRGAAAGSARSRLPAVLVAVQFAVAAFLLIVVTVTALQNAYLKRTGLGIAEDPLIVIENPTRLTKVAPETLRAELERLPHVRGVTEMAAPPFAGFSLTVVRSAPDPNAPGRTVFSHRVGHDFFEMFDVPLRAGRVFGREFGEDMPDTPRDGAEVRPRNIVVDDSLIAELGLGTPEQALDQLIYIGGGPGEPAQPLRIVGVVATRYFALFALGSARSAMYQLAPELQFAVARIDRTDVGGALAAVDELWRRLAPNVAPRREFFDTIFNDMYKSYLRIAQVMSVLASMAVLISVVGLFGMATLVMAHRRREVGIRKSLGAGIPQVTWLLLGAFAAPVVVANVIAWPGAYFAARRYLDFFIEPIALTPLPFLLALLVTVGIACAAVAGQTLRAARIRPADVLRSE